MKAFMKSIISLTILIVLILFITAFSNNTVIPLEKNIDDISSWKVYTNNKYHISFKYPYNWNVNPQYSDRYDGKDGFFQISAILGNNISIDSISQFDAFHKSKPFGTNPEISKLKVHGQEARLIMPSKDQDKHMNNQAELIVKYSKPVMIDGDTYYYFILWADKYHIHDIINTIKFIN